MSKSADLSKPLELTSDVNTEDTVKELRARAISAHQTSVGRGDELVQLLRDAVEQMKASHSRISTLSVIFFGFGLIVMGFGVYMALFGETGKEVWGAILGASGGLGAAATMFYTGPLTKISNSVTNLIKLETVFLGYIRVVGELDSAFQWQYIEKMSGAEVSLGTITEATTRQMKEMMTHAMKLIDEHVADETPSVMDLRTQVQEAIAQIDELKKAIDALKQ